VNNTVCAGDPTGIAPRSSIELRCQRLQPLTARAEPPGEKNGSSRPPQPPDSGRSLPRPRLARCRKPNSGSPTRNRESEETRQKKKRSHAPREQPQALTDHLVARSRLGALGGRRGLVGLGIGVGLLGVRRLALSLREARSHLLSPYCPKANSTLSWRDFQNRARTAPTTTARGSCAHSPASDGPRHLRINRIGQSSPRPHSRPRSSWRRCSWIMVTAHAQAIASAGPLTIREPFRRLAQANPRRSKPTPQPSNPRSSTVTSLTRCTRPPSTAARHRDRSALNATTTRVPSSTPFASPCAASLAISTVAKVLAGR
jgi:hypothetical protein